MARRLWTLAADGLPHSAEELASALDPEPSDELIQATRETLAFMDDAGLLLPLTA